MKDFKDKILVVTGAAYGLGEAVALEGAKRGMKLVLNDINPKVNDTLEECKKLGAEGVAQVADITLLENVQALFDLTMKTYGQIDMLFNNAGIAVATPIWEVPIQDIKWINEINFLSHALMLRVFLPQMIAQDREAAVVNVASAAGLITSGNAAMYHSTKAADVALAESTYLGLKQRGYKVQMHVFCPAYVQTNLHNSDQGRPERYADMSDPYYQGQEYKASITRTIHSIHTGMPIDAIGMTIFTAVEDGNFYILTHPEVLIPAGARFKNLVSFANPDGQ
jgi:NAD(P)-dependent dehydrogenase (short-subunit alcohol dehydrogenase family)